MRKQKTGVATHGASVGVLSVDRGHSCLTANPKPTPPCCCLCLPAVCVQVEFGLPELEGRTHIFKIHTKTMSVDKDIRYELIARLCPSSTGAEIR
jgi:hypothetical protein